jgi:hypothetical protein
MDDRDDARRRADEEEEQRFWEGVEEDRRLDKERMEAEQLAADEERAIEEMIDWFSSQFEDPQNETHYEKEDDRYIYMSGGPFEAADVLRAHFGGDHPDGWIQEAVDHVECNGITERAPRPHGNYYDHPEEDEKRPQDIDALARTARESLATLTEILPLLPTAPETLGHNAPPEEIGLPPYTDEDAHDAQQAIAEANAAPGEAEPDASNLVALSHRFEGWAQKIGSFYFAKKADLAVDEVIKNSIRAINWAAAIRAFSDAGRALLDLARHLGSH